ncbi:MAG: sialate O-acetylesterase [Acidobacteriota bacterium]
MSSAPSRCFRSLQMLVGLLAVLIAIAGVARAEVKLPALFSDHMVLQQDERVPIWGWAAEGEDVTVQFRGKKVRATARGGRWMAHLGKLRAGGPDNLTVSGSNTISISDVLVGEVWIASGQSNMEWALRRAHQPEQDIAAAADPQLRLFTVPKLKSDTPVNDVKSSWQLCTPETVAGFSAVAYYFARDLRKARGVPVGVIHTSWGGSPAEVWLSQENLASNPDYKSNILDAYPAAYKRYDESRVRYEKESAELKSQGKTPGNPPRAPWKPAELYNGMIAPLLPYAIAGAIWYQGESNASRAHQYRTLFPDMIANWRQAWGQKDFPFLAVQLAPFMKIKDQPAESDWAELREAQWLATRALPRVGLAVITDVGEENDIHPTKKAPVGARLALAARAIAYGEKVEYSGPVYKSMKIDGNRVVLSFDHVGGGLEARGGELRSFAIAGADGKFAWAAARIEGDRILVTSPEVSNPVAVRFGWADYPVVNLWNRAGLPAVPFRTDDFPMKTKP